MTISIRTLSYEIVAIFLLIANTATPSRAGFWSRSIQSSPTAVATPSLSAEPPPSVPARAMPRAAMPMATPAPLAHRMVGGEFDFIVADGNSFTKIGSRFGVSPRILARDNGKQVTDQLHAGDIIHIDNRHIVPLERANLIEINLPQRMLFHFEDWRVTGAYPVAIGQPSKQWRTPIGAFKVIQMREDPTWRVPASIQREEEAEGKAVEDEVEPGPDNPLGKYWIGLSMPIVGIHGTNHPITVYSYRTHGCVRLHPDDIEALFDAVELNDRGEIVYLPLMLARLDDGRIFLESQKDIYRKGTGGIDAVRALADATGIGSLIDWTRAGDVVRDEDGIARDVTLQSIRAGGTPNSNAATSSEQKPSAGNEPPEPEPSASEPKLEPISAKLPPH